ncbi:MAG: prolyl oligopeptidase family serine peptidase [Defluviitaleaceae bacterium]|nr:prolyl oligopeptidase family serine peptidase [Defluviitaleaceae bacterium]
MKMLPKRRETRRELFIEDFHGTKVADPYLWLNDDTDPEVKKWMDEQNSDFSDYINGFDVRNGFKERLTNLWNYERSSVPYKAGDFYYTWRNNGLQNQNVLYRGTLNDMSELVLDPNTLSDDGTVAINTFTFSNSGRYLAYSLSSKGSDWQTMHILDIETVKTLPDVLHHLKFTTPSWLPDDSGFFYSCFLAPKSSEVLEADAKNMMVRLHIIGQCQSEDKLIHKDDDQPEWNFTFFTDEDKKWAFLIIWYGTLRKNKLYFRPMDNLDAEWLVISDNFDENWEVAGVVDDIAYIVTLSDAPFGKIMSVKLSSDGVTDWKTIIPDTGEMLEYVRLVNNQLLCVNLCHATHRIVLYNLDGSFDREIDLPTVGSVSSLFAKQRDKEMFIQFGSVLYPNVVLKYDFEARKMSTVFASKIDFDFDSYETVQEFCTSKDGTKVPLFITKRKGIAKDGKNMALLYGYGGFNVSMTPSFSPATLAWLDKGGIHVEACIRGGNEYGEDWHRNGMLEKKQNVFDDFIAAAEYLIDEGYTSKDMIGIHGASNGGLLTGACLTQRPELLGAVIVHVPVIDMLRYHRFTIGRYWIGEFGSADNPEQFPFLYKYSPLHNVKMNTVYPPTLIMTADTDDRVVPSQARKFAATLQAADGGSNPIYIRIEKSAGHGMGKPISKVIDERADMLTFLYVNLSK